MLYGLALRAVGRDGVASGELPECRRDAASSGEHDGSVRFDFGDGYDFAVCEFLAVRRNHVCFDLQTVAGADGEFLRTANRQSGEVLPANDAQLSIKFGDHSKKVAYQNKCKSLVDTPESKFPNPTRDGNDSL